MTQQLRILLDARMLIGKFSGISRFVTRLADHLQRRGVDVVALCGTSRSNDWRSGLDVEILQVPFTRKHRSPWRRWIWESLHLPAAIRRSRADLFHATWNSGVPRGCGMPTVLTIHDVIPWANPRQHFHRRRDCWAYRHATSRSAVRATRVTTVSEFARREIAATLAIDTDRIETVYNGVDPPAHRGKVASERPYLLYVGGHEPRKNIGGLFRALEAYRRRYDDHLELHLTGHQHSLDPASAAALHGADPPLPVTFLGRISDAELAGQYAGAAALLNLSLDEGFGLPVLEAMAHGCPVVASCCASLPEVVGDAGLTVEPCDPDSAARALHRAVHDEDLRRTLVRAGRERAAAMSWEACAGKMIEVYLEALASRGAPRARRGATGEAELCGVNASST